jgi:hypothetical protein
LAYKRALYEILVPESNFEKSKSEAQLKTSILKKRLPLIFSPFFERITRYFCTKIKQKCILLLALVAVFLAPSFVSAQASLFSVVATDTIAGYSSTIKAFDIVPKKEVIFRIQKPDGGIIEINESADEAGVAELNFLGFHTKKAGTYQVWLYDSRNTKKNISPRTTFEVYPDSVSSVYSRIRVLENSATADGVEPVKVKVQLKDVHENPIPNHFVELISSRERDDVDIIGNGSTDEYGEIIFYIRSEEEGVAYFSVLDRNSGIILEERAKTIFFQDPQESRGGELFQGNIFRPQGIFEEDPEVETLDIFDPGVEGGNSAEGDGVVVGFEVVLESPGGRKMRSDPWDLLVTAVDKNGKKVSNYMGSIVLAASDEYIELPTKGGEVIEFGVDHQGMRGFYQGVTFPSSGTYTIDVVEFDMDEGGYTDIRGEATVEVFDECQENCEPDDPEPIEDDIFEIDSPISQNTYGSSNLIIKGVNKRKNNIKVYLDGREVATLEVNSTSGSFFENTSITAEDGQHTIYFEDVELLQKSPEIIFFIDGSPPELISQDIQPDGILTPEEMLTVTILSEENLAEAVLLVEDTNINKDFVEDTVQPGKYIATIRAPEEVGEYSLSIILKDDFDHTNNYNNVLSFTVGDSGSNSALSPPENLSYLPGETSAVLTWDMPDSSEAPKWFFIYSGGARDALQKFTEVQGDVTEKEINGLVPGEDRYFAVSSVDADRNESPWSEILTVNLEEKEPQQQNPEEPIPIEVGNSLQAIPGNGEVLLRWENPKTRASFFDVRFGIASGVYTERFLVRGDLRTATIPDLINGVAYYTTVVPLNVNGSPTGEIYEEKYVMPVFSGFHDIPEHEPKKEILKKVEKTEDVGPESLFLFLFSLFFSGALYFFHRAAIFYRM